MARALRIEYPGAVYHVMSRGNHDDLIFRDDADRETFLKCLGQAAQKTGWMIHAYVLMGNHYHLLLETPGGESSRGNEVAPRRLHSTIQRAAQALGASAAGALQGAECGWGRQFLFSDGRDLHSSESCPRPNRVARPSATFDLSMEQLSALSGASGQTPWLALGGEDAGKRGGKERRRFGAALL
jgi:REP element-mobilizing transposase RayT